MGCFQKKGASTYYGYTDKITNEYVVIQSIKLLSEIILGGKSTLEAYNPSLDRYYNDGGMLIIKGQANLKLPTGLINGGFENGLAGWQKDGDGRSITQLGSIRPTEGNRMGIISTGLGYTLVQGILNQSIYIPETVNTISFDWNFLSEEFLEFIGSKFDDPFVVSITLETQNNEEIKVLDINVNKIAEMFNATQYDSGNLISVSPDIVFDKGDVWMTGWQTTEIDIKDYRNQNVILKFSVEDAVDTIYTTAVLIDNVKFDVEDLYNGQRIEVDSSVFNEDYIRGIWFNDAKGSSYVLYCPDDFSSQAEFVRKQTKFFNGYKNIEQVKFHAIKTTKEFEEVWNNMEGHPDTGVIDDVILLFYSDYHAIFIDSSNRQYLTVSPGGFAGRGKTIYEAYHIRNLQKKKIKRIELLTCNKD
ncbi:MAG TPA: choice-of-anchor L domain-containing protein [Acetivibrio saccincola]|uniref:choice-of-anchor L domain-containing protein n=1 Tax=Acetivibrio saccincola TaxID=1677857 RepID=UPI002BBFCBAC|nr:choice-of-anchor L domain-containing protein [Acetivibrio saccincola]HOA96224.1 choice-of-anchor L domain-containing protein [Acetivibrio saccincola]HQD27791.1 choice-of-anchor L domain-containing protein [Acetivibrio saccincola]